jgi:beta-fructofuranosidase
LQQLIYSTDLIEDRGEFVEQLVLVGQQLAARHLQKLQACIQPVSCEHRPKWHISSPQGHMQDPTGFIYYQGQYHLFHLWAPEHSGCKDCCWAHRSSSDFVNWQWQPVALTPSDWFDSHGNYSGHAVSQGDELMLFYTGNVRIGEQRDRHTTQCLATSSDGIHFTKQGPVVPELPPGVTPHCRDPKVIRHNDRWLMLLGAQRENKTGCIAVYQSDDLKNWQFLQLCGEELGEFGYMWECPDYFSLNGQGFLVFCPQGVQSEYTSNTVIHHSGITKAEIDKNGKLFLSDFQHLDYGFDFYAPQSIATPDGRRVMIAWLGLPDETEHPSLDNGWNHQLTTFRELLYENGRLRQRPIKELQKLRCEKLVLADGETFFDLTSKAFELLVTMEWGSFLRLHQSEQGYCEIRLDRATRTLFLDRSKTLQREGDAVRELVLTDSSSVQLHILSDNSSLEVFINNGEAVMSARIFTAKDATQLSYDGEVQLQTCWLINGSSSLLFY